MSLLAIIAAAEKIDRGYVGRVLRLDVAGADDRGTHCRWTSSGRTGAWSRKTPSRSTSPTILGQPAPRVVSILKVDGTLKLDSRKIPDTIPFAIAIDEPFDISTDTRTPVIGRPRLSGAVRVHGQDLTGSLQTGTGATHRGGPQGNARQHHQSERLGTGNLDGPLRGHPFSPPHQG